MATRYPLCTEQIQTGCVYFQENDIYHAMLEELQGSIRIIAQDRVVIHGGSITDVIAFLINTFGGNTADYKYWRCGLGTFRIQIPQTLNMALVIENGNVWGDQAGWRLMEWDTVWDARMQIKPFRVRIRVMQFPEGFWHPFFINQLASQFGNIVSTDEGNIQGHNHMNLCMWVRYNDPIRIPYNTVLHYGHWWKECTIQVITWEYTVELPNEPGLPPLEDSIERHGSDITHNEFFVRRSMLNLHDFLVAEKQNQPFSPEPLSASNPTDDHEISAPSLMHHDMDIAPVSTSSRGARVSGVGEKRVEKRHTNIHKAEKKMEPTCTADQLT